MRGYVAFFLSVVTVFCVIHQLGLVWFCIGSFLGLCAPYDLCVPADDTRTQVGRRVLGSMCLFYYVCYVCSLMFHGFTPWVLISLILWILISRAPQIITLTTTTISITSPQDREWDQVPCRSSSALPHSHMLTLAFVPYICDVFPPGFSANINERLFASSSLLSLHFVPHTSAHFHGRLCLRTTTLAFMLPQYHIDGRLCLRDDMGVYATRWLRFSYL